MIPMPFILEFTIVLFAVLYAGVSLSIQRKLSNPRKMREINAKVKAVSNELNKMMKEGAAKEEIMKKQGEMMPMLNETMKNQFKPLVVVFPVFLFVYYVFLPYAFGPYSQFQTNFIVPLGYKGVFITTLFIAGLISSLIVIIYDKKKSSMETKEREAQGQNNVPQINK